MQPRLPVASDNELVSTAVSGCIRACPWNNYRDQLRTEDSNHCLSLPVAIHHSAWRCMRYVVVQRTYLGPADAPSQRAYLTSSWLVFM